MIILPCPHCGERNVTEFRFGGEYLERPANADSPEADEAWADYLYLKRNEAGLQKEWWYHRAGCRRWFLAERHTVSQVVAKTYLWEPK
jgi:heterotetrameric sarcosine oxidase delta subunit